MRLIKISRKHFTVGSDTMELLEAYSDPANQLIIQFELVVSAHGVHYYKAIVKEKQTNDAILLVHFDLDENNPNAVRVNSIEPLGIIDPHKTVYTTAGSQHTGADIGHTAIKWLSRQIRQYARLQGFDILQVVSSTRITGARAKNNPSNNDLAHSFNVAVNVKESIVYDFTTNTINIIRP